MSLIAVDAIYVEFTKGIPSVATAIRTNKKPDKHINQLKFMNACTVSSKKTG